MATLFGIGTTTVESEKNPVLDRLKSRSDQLTLQFNPLQREIVELRIADLPDGEVGTLLNDLARRANSLQHDMLSWENDAKQYLIIPNLEFTHAGPEDRASLDQLHNHVVQVVTMLRDDTRTNRLILVDNHANLVAEARTQQSLNLANASLNVSKESLVLAKESLDKAKQSLRGSVFAVFLALIGIVFTIAFANRGCSVFSEEPSFRENPPQSPSAEEVM